jgi:choline-glycine betaine transporter
MVFGIKPSTTIEIIVIIVMTVIFVLSAVSGVTHGIKWLANLHMALAGVLAAFVFFAGPAVFILNATTSATGGYLFHLLPMSFQTAAFGGGQTWLDTWTIFYWAWWVSWALHVGTFLARVSRGRTIRQFVLGVVGVPTVVSIIWFGVFGGSALHAQFHGDSHLVSLAAQSEAGALFGLLKTYPFFVAAGVLTMLLVALFFIASANAGSFVLAMLSSRGSPSPREDTIALWGVMTGVVAIVLLVVGGLAGIQTFDILVSCPFMLIMVALCWSVYRDLRTDPMWAPSSEPAPPLEPAGAGPADGPVGARQAGVGPAVRYQGPDDVAET